jgi:hypothetical protein
MENTPPRGYVVDGEIARRGETLPGESVPSGLLTPAERRRALLQSWILDVKAASLAHRSASRHRGAINLGLGGTVIVLSIASVALSASSGGTLGIVGTCVSAIATICACFQTFSKSSETSAKSHQTAAEYSSIQRKIEILLTQEDPPEEAVQRIQDERFLAASQCPIIPDRFNRDARREVGLPPKPSGKK